MKITRDNIHEVIIRMAYGSVCKASIIPIQDILGLDEKARMNTPASIKGNWIWRLQAKSLNKSLTRQLASLTLQFGRN